MRPRTTPRRSASRTLWFLAALAFAACSGGGGSGPAPAPTQPPGQACPDVIQVRSAPLVQPANGATGIATTIGSVTVTSEQGLAGVQITLTPSGGSPVEGGTFAAVSSTTMAATVPVLSAHTTYTVSASSSVPDGNCLTTTDWTIGTFTTQ